MTNSLREKAQAKASQSWGHNTSADAEQIRSEIREPEPDLVPFPELTEPTSADPEQVPVHIAWARVMRDVHALGKHGLYNAAGTRYNFRGVDAVLNAFGPVVRRHGVIVLPQTVRAIHSDATTSKGNPTRETTVTVSYRIIGPMGDFLDGEAEGEALDSSDKGSAKAQSVAMRVFLIAASLLPTDEKDPDASRIERGERPLPRAGEYVEEVCDPRTSVSRIRQIYQEAKRHSLLAAPVTNEVGEPEELGALILRIDAARTGGGQ